MGRNQKLIVLVGTVLLLLVGTARAQSDECVGDECDGEGWRALDECVGDCSGGDGVKVDDLLVLIRIAMGEAPTSSCPHGIESGSEVDVGVLIRAARMAMKGCLVRDDDRGGDGSKQDPEFHL